MKQPKPDGWYVYHICGGLLRELTIVSHGIGTKQAMCPHCGEWYEGIATKERPRDQASGPIGRNDR